MKLTKESRQRATAAMLKCPCGNVARKGFMMCGSCQDATDERCDLEQQLADCETVDDLKHFITTYLIDKE